ncbi:MAG: TIGR01212 family radical SAM protein [Nitrospirae bacterium]|nr:TIGR01212 family radical SAM protein [Nitrospirota bacterium]
MQRYNSFGRYIKSLFGLTVYKVNVDAGFTCPNRDGTVGYGGCIYCNNDSFRPSSCRPVLPVREQISNGLVYLRKRYGAERFIVYFQPYTNTHAPVERLEEMYREALDVPDVVGLAIGTRPDCIDEAKVGLLEELARDHFILVEYGLQSVYDRTLEFINRGHDYASFVRAVDLTYGRGIHIGAHLIAGFPTETEEEMLRAADAVSALPVEFLKIHQLQVVKDTRLAELYRETPFPLFGYEEYVDFVVRFIERLSPSIVLQRVFATAPDSILIAPLWGKGRHEILRDISEKLEELDTYQGRCYKPTAPEEIILGGQRSM